MSGPDDTDSKFVGKYPESIDNEEIPCCDNPAIEIRFMADKNDVITATLDSELPAVKEHYCGNCGSLRPELD